MQRSIASRRDVVDDVAALLLERGGDTQPRSASPAPPGLDRHDRVNLRRFAGRITADESEAGGRDEFCPSRALEFRDPRLQRDDLRLLLGDDLQQLRDDTQRLLQRPGSQIGRKRCHTSTGTLSTAYAHYIFACGKCTP